METSIRISFAKVAVPRFKNTELSGFGSRDAGIPSMGPEELAIKILWLKCSEDIVFISIDSLYVPDFFSEAIAGKLYADFGVNRLNVVFGATHTHSSYSMGFFNDEVSKSDSELLIEAGCKLVEIASAKFVAAKIFSFDETTKDITINRRRTVFNPRNFRYQSTSLPNLNKSSANLVAGIFISTCVGDTYIIFSFACHPVFNRNMNISADYPGEVINRLISNGVVSDALFFQGFGADIRPNYVLRRSDIFKSQISFRDRLKVLFYGDIFKPLGPREFNHFCENLVEAISKAEFMEIAKFKFVSSTRKFPLCSDTGKTVRELYVSLVSLGGRVNFLSMSGEIHINYRDIFTSPGTINISCTNNHIGYVPDSSDFGQGGYEVVQSAINFGWDSPISVRSLTNFKKEMAIWLFNDIGLTDPRMSGTGRRSDLR